MFRRGCTALPRGHAGSRPPVQKSTVRSPEVFATSQIGLKFSYVILPCFFAPTSVVWFANSGVCRTPPGREKSCTTNGLMSLMVASSHNMYLLMLLLLYLIQ